MGMGQNLWYHMTVWMNIHGKKNLKAAVSVSTMQCLEAISIAAANVPGSPRAHVSTSQVPHAGQESFHAGAQAAPHEFCGSRQLLWQRQSAHRVLAWMEAMSCGLPECWMVESICTVDQVMQYDLQKYFACSFVPLFGLQLLDLCKQKPPNLCGHCLVASCMQHEPISGWTERNFSNTIDIYGLCTMVYCSASEKIHEKPAMAHRFHRWWFPKSCW